MQFPDLINGAFEFFAGVLSYQNVKSIRRSKGYSGVHWVPTAFFSSWGVWNLYYYPSLSQWVSFFGGLAICGVNLTWLYYAFLYGQAGEYLSSEYLASATLMSRLRRRLNGISLSPRSVSQAGPAELA